MRLINETEMLQLKCITYCFCFCCSLLIQVCDNNISRQTPNCFDFQTKAYFSYESVLRINPPTNILFSLIIFTALFLSSWGPSLIHSRNNKAKNKSLINYKDKWFPHNIEPLKYWSHKTVVTRKPYLST